MRYEDASLSGSIQPAADGSDAISGSDAIAAPGLVSESLAAAAAAAEAQRIVPGPDGVVVLPAGVELSDIRVVGRDLVITLPNGEQMIIVDGAVFVPQLVINNVEVPAANLAALLIDSEPQPAAGQAQSSGGNFGVPVAPLDPGVPLGDLLPPTDLSYTPPEFRDPGFFLRDEEEDRDVEIGENAVVQLDDDALAGGNPGGTGDDPDGANTSGFLSGSGGNGPLTFDLLTTGAPTGFTYEDGPDGSVLVKQGGTVVLTITVDAATGEYSVTQNAPIMHPAGGDENNVVFTVSYTVTDDDGDSQTGTLTINVDDDTPTIDVAAAADDGVVLVTDDADTIGSNSDTATSTADFSGVFSLSFSPGADGASSTPVLSYELGTAGGASGLTQGGAAINLYLIGGVVIGSTAASAAEVTAANTVFDVSVDASGTVTLTQYSQIDHTNTDPSPTGAPFSDQLIALVDSAVTLTATADYSDNDGDPASDSATIEIGANLQFSDDGPRLVDVAIGRGVVIDETTAGTPAGFPISATSAGAMISASALFGADGPAASNALSFGISINGGGTTPLATAIGDYPITLVQNGANQIIGQFDDGSGVQTAFTVTMNADGSVTVVQNVPLEHLVDGPPGPAHNDPLSLTGLINGTVTATDFDGDTATATIDLGSGIVFRDDGPKAIIDNDADSRLILTTQDADTIGEASDTASVDFSTIIKASGLPGADGGTVLPLSYALGTVGGTSGLTQGGQPINLFLIDGVVVGSTATVAANVTAANTVFDVSVTQTGVVTLTQHSQIDHPAALDPTPGGAPYSDQLVSLVDDLVTLSATVTVVDNDGDVDARTVTLGIGSNLQFADDGPRAIIDNDADSSLVLTTQDADTIGTAADSASVDFSTIINASGIPGADGGTVQPLSYQLGTVGGASGLTQGGQPINLFLIDGVVVGSTANSAAEVSAANTVFDVSVTQGGVVTLTQYSQIDHSAALDPTPGGAPYSDQLVSLVDDLVTLSATVTVVDNDGDVDARTVTLGIGANFQFADDGPVVTDLVVGSGVSVDETAAGTPAGFPISATSSAPVIDTTGIFGADGPAASGSLSFAIALIGGGSTELRTAIGDHPITLVQVNSTTIEGHYNDGTEQLAFTVTMNADGSITIEQNVPLEHLVDGPEGPAHNDPLTLDGLIEASVTVTDFDGDTASGSVEIGSVITFRDDGPRAIIDNDPDTDLVLTTQDADTIGAASGTASVDFSTIINASGIPGADGGVVQSLSYQLGTAGGSSGLTQDGAAINLFLIGGVVVGSTASSAVEVTSANTVFDVSVTQGGVVTLTQYSQIDHPAAQDPTPGGAPYSDQLVSLTDDLVTLSATVSVVDNDGDTASRTVTLGIGSNLQFADDGPVAVADIDIVVSGATTATGNVLTDASDGDVGDSDDGADNVGADSPGRITAIAFGDSSDSSFDANGNLQIEGQFGTLTIDAQGNYVYTRNGGAGGGQSETFTYTLTDADGDSATATLTISIVDNVPTAGTVVVTIDDDALPNGNPDGIGDDADAVNTAGTLPGSGGDGALSFDLLLTGAPSGFTYIDGPDGSLLVQQNGVTVLTVTVDAASGAYSVTQNAPITHPGGDAENNVLIDIGYSVTDSDGSSAVGTISINVDDDTPTVGATIATSPNAQVTLDETDAGSPGGFPISATSSVPAINATVLFGADGPAASGALTYGLSVNGDGTTSITTAIGDHPIKLVQIDSTTIEGRYNDGTEQLAFTVTMNADGTVTVVQQVPLEHLIDGPEGPAHNDPLTLDGLIQASVTVTDGDGDTTSASVEIGSIITFRDDGPRATIDNDPDTDVVLTTQDADTIGAATDIATADFSTIIGASGIPGADGGIVQPLSYQLGTVGGASGLTQDGAAINLFLISGVVVGSTAASAAEVTSANTVFDVSVTQGGVVTLNQYSQIDHPAGLDPTPGGAPYSDQLASLVDDLVTLSATVTVIDNDGDTASRSVTLGIGSNIQFADDGPAITSPATANSTVILDETAGSSPLSSGAPISVTSAAAMISAAVDYGADGQGAAPVYGLSLLNGSAIGTSIASGLTTAAGDFPITLTLTSATTIAGTYDDGGIKTAFTLTMNADGTVTVMQYEALEHLQDGATAAHHNDALTLVNASLQSLVNATVTYQDGDADTVSSSVGIGSAITFLDDGGTLGSFTSVTVANVPGTTGSGTFAYDPGADGHGSFSITGPALEGVTYSTVQNANGALLTATIDPDGPGGNAPVTAFTLQVNADGTYDFTFNMLETETTNTVSLKGLSPGGPTPFVQTPDGLVEFTGSGNGVNSSTPGFGISNQFVGNGESFTIEFHSVGQAGNQASSENATFVNSAVLHNDNINGSLTIKVTFHNDVTGETEVQTIAVTGSSTVLDPATMSQFNWVEIEGVGGTGQGVRFTSLDYTTKTVSQDLDLAFQVQAMDQDGDVTSVQALSVTVDANPSSLATLRTLEGPSSSTTNATVFAAVAAAAGLAALPAAAEPLKSDDGYAPLPLETQSVGNAVVGKVAIDAPDAESNPALFGADTASVDDEAGQPNGASRTSHSDVGETSSLDDGAGQDAAQVNSAATDQADAPVANVPAPAAEIVMPSAEALSTLVGKSESVDGESAAKGDASVGKVLADALNGGGNGPDIDALLAALPDGNAVNGGGNPATEGLASHQPDAVPGWDSGHFAGLSQGPAFMMEAAVLHHDAVPAA